MKIRAIVTGYLGSLQVPESGPPEGKATWDLWSVESVFCRRKVSMLGTNTRKRMIGNVEPCHPNSWESSMGDVSQILTVMCILSHSQSEHEYQMGKPSWGYYCGVW